MRETNTGEFDSFDHEEIDLSGSTVQGLTATKYAPVAVAPALPAPSARLAVISVETANIRYWTDGTDPTSSVGLLVAAGSTITLFGRKDIKGFRAVPVSGSPKLMVQYKR